MTIGTQHPLLAVEPIANSNRTSKDSQEVTDVKTRTNGVPSWMIALPHDSTDVLDEKESVIVPVAISDSIDLQF